MKIKILILLPFAIFFLPLGISFAQSATSPLKWTSNSFVNSENNETVSHTCEFETTIQKIKLVQKGGAHVYEFDIVGQSGSWPNVNIDGLIVFSVTFRGNNGSIRFERKGTTVTIQPDIAVSGKNILPYTFNITTITEL